MEAALAAILNFAGSMLASKIFEEFGSTMGVKKSLHELQQVVEEIKSVLQNAGDKVIKNDPSFNWLKELKYVAYDIDDLLNEFCMEVEKHKAKSDGEKHVLVKCFYERPKSVLFRHKLANKTKTIKGRFKAIVSQRMELEAIIKSLPMHPTQNSQLVIGELPSSTIIDEKSIFGRDRDKSNIIGELIKTNDRERISVISIIGLGGSGKTTLAKLIFNDENEVRKHFEVRSWVYVSQHFDVAKLIGKLFEDITTETPEHKSLQSMSTRISNMLSGKKFLLVLDDVWNEDQLKWDQFIQHLKDGAAGSRILITTRSKKVAEAVKSTVPYDLVVLSEDDGWKLFQQSSGRAENDLDQKFVEIGKEIVKKCGGVPLALKSLGSTVGSKKEINSWRAVRDSELWNVEDRVFASLMLSYFHLPSYLQPCFLHCSIFPKGYKIEKHSLIAEWIAHGFITSVNEVEQLEDIGNDYFDSLVKISFLQDLVEDDDYGTTCKMHDVVHDLTRHILQDEIISKPEDITNDFVPRCRYLSLTKCGEKIDRRLFNKVRALYVANENLTFDKRIKKARYVRTAILDNIDTMSLPPFILQLEYLGYLRVSNLGCEALPDAISCCWNLQALHVTYCTRLLTLPESIGKLKKLRTLDLSGDSNVELLPQSIGGCYNLQSLHLISCKSLKEIPASIVNLKKLEVLNLKGCAELCGLPVGIGQLSLLQRLGLFVVGDGKKHARISELGSLDMISGSLQIKNIMYVEGSADDEEKAYLKKKKKLQRLTLRWSTSEHEVDMMEQEVALLNGLEPPSGIVSLSIYHYPGRQFSNWMKNLVSLQQLEISLLPALELLPESLGELRSLQHLRILSCDGLRQLPESMKNLVSLQHLELYWLPALELLPESLGELRSLQHLEIHWCFVRQLPESMKNLVSLQHLEIRGLPALELLPESLGELRSLQHLRILRCNGLRQLPESMKNLVSLQHLQIADLPALELLPESLGELRSLQHLEIISLPALELLPESLGELRSLQHLRILRCDGLRQLPESMKNLVSLQHLQIEDLPALKLLPESLGELRSLQHLEIHWCFMRQLPESMKNLVSLQHLQIEDLLALELLPESLGELRSLQHLEISWCVKLRQLPESMKNLVSLQHLKISWCDGLRQLPESMKNLVSLQHLEIIGLTALELLPESLGELRSLQHLRINDCDGLRQLPESMKNLGALRYLRIGYCRAIKSLPRSIQHLTSLQKLEIDGCPGLEKRCKRGEGEAWRLISHIPNIVLGHGV